MTSGGKSDLADVLADLVKLDRRVEGLHRQAQAAADLYYRYLCRLALAHVTRGLRALIRKGLTRNA